jgi:hypothetical protein
VLSKSWGVIKIVSVAAVGRKLTADPAKVLETIPICGRIGNSKNYDSEGKRNMVELLQLQAKRFTTDAAVAKAAKVLLEEDSDCLVTILIGNSQSFENMCEELSALDVDPDRIDVVRREYLGNYILNSLGGIE